MIKFYKDSVGEWRWTVRAKNYKIVGAASEGFASRQKAVQNYKCLLKYMKKIKL